MKNSHFIRGGQTALHEYRMSIQVVKTLAWIVFGIALAFMLGKLVLNLTIHEAYQWFIWHWAQFLYLASFKYEQEITIYDYDWVPYVTYTGAIIDHTGMTATKDKVEILILSGSGMGLTLGLIIAVFAAGYFLWRGARLQRAKHLRGSKLLPAPELIRQVKSFNKSRKVGTPYSIAGIPYPAGAPVTHTMIC
ncbi:MAG: hypothetical protein JKY27_06060, partial [Magnetovibrio sp.]|nr:hypothetical protein [Magnetovibrio sp.]